MTVLCKLVESSVQRISLQARCTVFFLVRVHSLLCVALRPCELVYCAHYVMTALRNKIRMLAESSVRHKFRFEHYAALFERRVLPNNAEESDADSIRNTALAAELQRVSVVLLPFWFWRCRFGRSCVVVLW